ELVRLATQTKPTVQPQSPCESDGDVVIAPRQAANFLPMRSAAFMISPVQRTTFKGAGDHGDARPLATGPAQPGVEAQASGNSPRRAGAGPVSRWRGACRRLERCLPASAHAP